MSRLMSFISALFSLGVPAAQMSAVVLVLTGLAGCISSPRDVLIEPPKVLTRALDTDSVLQIRIPPGEATIQGVGGDQLRVRLELRCNSATGGCAKRAAKAVIVTEVQEGEVIVKLEPRGTWAYRNTDVRMDVQVPRTRHVRVTMGAGELKITDVAGCVYVEMGAGDIELTAPLADVHRVELDANVGDASLRLPEYAIEGPRSLLVGAHLEWHDGTGLCDLEIRLQAGDIDVRLH